MSTACLMIATIGGTINMECKRMTINMAMMTMICY